MNMIIGKRQIILASLVLGLGIAVFLNAQYSKSNLDLDAAALLEEGTNYGEAQYVDSQNLEADAETGAVINEDDETFFVEAKVSRQKARDEAVETLANMLQDADLTAEQKENLAIRATDLAKSIEIEGKIENMIKAKGFEDVMVYYDTERTDVIVKTEGLLSNEAAQIKDIILTETGISAEKITIVEVS